MQYKWVSYKVNDAGNEVSCGRVAPHHMHTYHGHAMPPFAHVVFFLRAVKPPDALMRYDS